MEKVSLQDVVKDTPVIIHSGRYVYLQAKEVDSGDHFFVSRDDDEVTIVTREENVDKVIFEKMFKWFKLFEFKVSIPFLAPGFIAKISTAIANKGLNILIVSTFSKDYILILEDDYETAVEVIKSLGFEIIVNK